MVMIASEVRWQDRQFVVPIEKIKLLEQWGYDAIFTAEFNGSDGLTPLAFIAGQTSRIKLGTRIAQVSARSPTWLAQAFQTIDRMAGGDRVIAGLGSSSARIAEGWHGVRWGSPVARMRDTVAIMRQVFAGDQLVEHHGEGWSIPYPGDDATAAEPWLPLMEMNPNIPIIVGAGQPRMTELAGEVADGFYPIGFAPGMMSSYQPLLEAGFARAGGGKSMDGFDVWVHVDIIVSDDIPAAMQPLKEYVAYYSETLRKQMEFRGYQDLCNRLQELRAEGRLEEAAALVPDEYIDEGWLVGPIDRVVRRLDPWLRAGATGVIFRYGPQVGGRNVTAGEGAETPEENLEVFRAIARAVGKPGAG
jgi:F420-dependent oxidoreductase-like protein